jgi:hypothetical protein
MLISRIINYLLVPIQLSFMLGAQSGPDLAPDPSRLTFGPLLEGLPLVLAGAAAIFILVLILYFLLRGKKRY